MDISIIKTIRSWDRLIMGIPIQIRRHLYIKTVHSLNYYAMLCYAMLCYAMLCYAMRCDAIRYDTILYDTLYCTILYDTKQNYQIGLTSINAHVRGDLRITWDAHDPIHLCPSLFLGIRTIRHMLHVKLNYGIILWWHSGMTKDIEIRWYLYVSVGGYCEIKSCPFLNIRWCR